DRHCSFQFYSTFLFEQFETGLLFPFVLQNQAAIAGVIDLETVKTFSVFQAAQRGLIDQDTCCVLLEAQLVMGGLVRPDSSGIYSLAHGLSQGLIDNHTCQSLAELERALEFIRESVGDQKHLPVAAAMESGLIREEVGLRILELQMNSGGLRDSYGKTMSLEQAEGRRVLSPRILNKLYSRRQHKELIDPNTAEKVNIEELKLRCFPDDISGLLLLPVKQQPGGTVCLLSGKKVGIFRAVKEGLIDRAVAIRLLETQLFAGGISEPRSGHRLMIGEAVRHGLMDQDLASAILARQLQNGGILDPLGGERLDLEESIRRDLLSPRLALLVLESLWTFTGLLWPESGELMPIAEALQQGVISGDLARNILRQRHTIGGLYNPETLQVLLLDQAAEEHLEPSVVRCLRDIHIPDILYNMNQSCTSSLNRPSWGSTSSSPSPLSSSTAFVWEASPRVDPDDQAKHKLLFHLMTHSYVDAHFGKRLVLLDRDLMLMVKATGLAAVELRKEKKEMSSLERKMFSTKHHKEEAIKCQDKVVHETVPRRQDVKDTITKSSFESEEDIKNDASQEHVPGVKENKDFNLTEPQEFEDKTVFPTDLAKMPQCVSKRDSNFKQTETVVGNIAPQIGEAQEDAELEGLVLELKQGGLVTKEGEKLLPDEAVAQGVLPGFTAVKLMAQAGLFGGFLDATSGESLSLEEVMQEGLLDEDLMWSVLKSDKSLAGVVDVEKGQICGVRAAAQAGLIDPNTAVRLLEAQVVSGGIVDLRSDKKVSVMLAANLGLIEEGQREELIALEKAFKGKYSDSATCFKKASLQLQMEGVVDPESNSAVPLEQAIKKGLIASDEAYRVLARQVAEGGIIHHASGMRLSVSDAVDRGLVDRSIASGLEELEWIYRGKVSTISNPEAIAFQATTGAILDSDSGAKLTLTEAVSRGLLDENIATEVMASPTVTQGMIDPKTARIVPYSELVSQGKINIETGKRFLEVKPFQGIQDKKTLEILTIPEAVALKWVDPVPALRLLQSQADTGGIIDISTGERLPLPEASARGLVGGDMVKEIAINQFVKGGLVDPATGQRVSNLGDAISFRLLTRDLALEIQEKVKEVFVDDHSTPIVATGSSPDSPVNMSAANITVSSRSPSSVRSLEVSEDYDKTLRSEISGQSLFCPEVEIAADPESVEKKSLTEPEQSMDVLSEFASNVEKRIQKAIQEIMPQKDDSKLENLLQQELSDTMENNGKQSENLTRTPVKESTQILTDHNGRESQKEVQKEDGKEPKKDEVMECRPINETTKMVHHVSDDVKVAVRVDKQSKDAPGLPAVNEEVKEVGKPLEAKTSTDVEQSDQFSSSASNQLNNKSKKKRKNKKKAEEKEVQTQIHLLETKHESQTDQTSPKTTEIPKVAPIDTDQIRFYENLEKSDSYLAPSTDPPSEESMERIEVKIEQEQEAVVSQPSSQMEKGAAEIMLFDTSEKVGGTEDVKREEEEDWEYINKTSMVIQTVEPEIKSPSGTDGKPPEMPQVAPVDIEGNTFDGNLQKLDSYDVPPTTDHQSGKSMPRTDGKVETEKVLIEQEQEVVSQLSFQVEKEAAETMLVDNMEDVKRKEKEEWQSMKVLIVKQTEEPEMTSPSQAVQTGAETPEMPQVAPVNTDQITFDENLQKSVSYDLSPMTDPNPEDSMQKTEGEVDQEQKEVSLEANTQMEKDAVRAPEKVDMKEEEGAYTRVLIAQQTEEPEKEYPSQTDAGILEKPWVAHFDTEENTSDENLQKSDSYGVSPTTDPHFGVSMEMTDGKVEIARDLVEKEQEEVYLEPSAEMEKDAAKTTLSKTSHKVYKQEEVKRDVEVGRESTEKAEEPENNQVQQSKEEESLKKSTLKDDEKAALILKAKESILKKVFEKGVSEKQAAQELEKLRQKETRRKKSTPADDKKTETTMGEDDTEKRSSGLPKDSNDQVTVKKDTVELDKTPEGNLGLTSSSERENIRAFQMADSQKDAATLPSVSRSKRSKRSKKSRSLKTTEDQPEMDKGTTDLKDPNNITKSAAEPESDGIVLAAGLKMKADYDGQSGDAATKLPKSLKTTEDQPDSEKLPSDGRIDCDLKDSKINSKSAAQQQSKGRFLSEDLSTNTDVDAARSSDVGKADRGDPQGAKSQKEQASEGLLSDPSEYLSEEVSKKQDIEPAAQSVAPDPHSGRSKRKKKQQLPEAESSDVPISLTNLQQHLESPETAVLSKEDSLVESETSKGMETEPSTESLEDEEQVCKNQETVLNTEGATSTGTKECLEHDQRVVALLSMVRHMEVRLKQQQQQSVGHSLITLDDIIRQTELILALEKDGRSLARGYEAARALSEGILERLRHHRDLCKDAVTAEQESLGQHVDRLLSWLSETQAQMDGGTTGRDKKETTEKDDGQAELTQQLNVCKVISEKCLR
ncbi:hypothetical protein XENOCAPTIV_015529, partial [Xenoophorus captivus]